MTRKLLKAGYMEERQHHNIPRVELLALYSQTYISMGRKMPKYNRDFIGDLEYRKHTTRPAM